MALGRLKVLLSAYACEPGKGSEPEVGWQWALQMARFHDVTVLTRENNRGPIEAELAKIGTSRPVPRFVYHDCGRFLLWLKGRTRALQLYYLLWQKSAWYRVQGLHQKERFELLHHVTFAAYRYPAAIWGHGAPTVWGPVGGIESVPVALLPWTHPVSLAREITRNFSNLVQGAPYHVLPRRAEASSVILSSTREMQELFEKLGFHSIVMPTIGLEVKALPERAKAPPGEVLNLLFVGNIITLKGLDLALEALAESGTRAHLTLLGSGDFMNSAARRVEKLGLGERVHFRGRLPRKDVLEAYSRYDVFLFPSLHDTGGYAVIEAMFNRLPVICLDCGGPAVAVQPGCGVKVPLGNRKKIVSELAAAIRHYDSDRSAVRSDGERARQEILERYDWDQKGLEMNHCYEEAIRRHQENAPAKGPNDGFFGPVGQLLNRVFFSRGMLTTALSLLLVGALGFISVEQLKKKASEIVNDTLPGLTYAGEANASLAQGFNRILLYVVTQDNAERARIRKEIESFSATTGSYLRAYGGSVYTQVDRRNFRALLQARESYITLRDKTFGLVSDNRAQEALRTYQYELLPAYEKYKRAGDALFEYNIREGRGRGVTIMRVCTVTQWLVAAVGILIFVLGFFIGTSR